MSWIEALILGLIQGLTEFLPVSSSGHLEIGQVLLGVESKENLTFTIIVHGATVLSIIVCFYSEIRKLVKGTFQFTWNKETQYVFKILVSMIPVAILGVFFTNQVESLFTGNLLLVGCMLIVTSLLLFFTYLSNPKHKEVSFFNSVVIGMVQAMAVIPGISRSGSTIAVALLLGVKRENAAKFSFLMVLIPIILANLKDVFSGEIIIESIGILPLLIGFLAAFLSGLIACKAMIQIVNKGKLIYFAIYCSIVGSLAIIFSL